MQNQWNPIKLAWAAGFIDGEGTFGSYTSGSARLTVGQAHREPLDKLVDAFGLGKVSGPDKNGMYTYAAAGFAKVQQVFILLSPYLGSVKTKQATDVLIKVKQVKRKWQVCLSLGHSLSNRNCNTCNYQRRKKREE